MTIIKAFKNILCVVGFLIIISGGIAFGQDGIIAEIDDDGNGGIFNCKYSWG
jgi:hypothetical protein